jgi:sugar phosphate isomerase/epimerase
VSSSDISRRTALAMTGAALAATLSPGTSPAGEATGPSAAAARPPLTIFSRQLHWVGFEDAIEMAVAAGFGGIAWTVRKDAHIAPENVARDLPRAVELTRKAGLGTPHIVTAINDADTPHAEAMVETAAGLGIRTYRIQTSAYDLKSSMPAQLEALRPRMAGLVKLNERHGATAVIHTHIGLVAGGVWDTWLLLREFDPERIGINFDSGYGTAGVGAGWMQAVQFARRHIRMLSLKDFRWRQTTPEICVPGQGVVDYAAVLGYFQSTDFRGPVEIQYEYPVAVAGRSKPFNLKDVVVGQGPLELPQGGPDRAHEARRRLLRRLAAENRSESRLRAFLSSWNRDFR